MLLIRLQRRLKWLLSTPNMDFGVLIEKTIFFLIDVSGSMVNKLEELKESLKSVIRHQILRLVKLSIDSEISDEEKGSILLHLTRSVPYGLRMDQ